MQPPPKYVWFQDDIHFENVLANGEFLYSPAWDHQQSTLRIDKPLQTAVKIKPGPAQNYTDRTIKTRPWYKNQIVQTHGKTGDNYPYYIAIKDVPKSIVTANPGYWRKTENPFDITGLIYMKNK